MMQSKRNIDIMKYFLPLIMTLLSFTGFAQIDDEFWFGAPDLTMGTANEARRDSTVYIVVSSFNQPTEVEILQPANLSFEPIVVSLPPNTVEEVNLGLFLSLIETKPANAVLNTGLLIRSDQPITAYYEVRSPNNTDLWSLKGANSVGTEFVVPFQNEFRNNQTLGNQPYIPGPRSGFIVMATRNNTTVSITPSIDILGHPGGETFEVFLQRGQTYYCEALDGTPENHPSGSMISSDKPITVTLKDDMVDVTPQNDGGADVIGDQLVANEFLGTEHIIIDGSVTNNSDRIVVCATVDNTEVYVSGDPTPAAIINAGEQYSFAPTETATFLETSEPVSVLQVTGFQDQVAGAIIPSLGCRGSNRVGFVRGSSGPFILNVTIRAGSEGLFELNGDPNLVPASAFDFVPGSNDEYVWAQIQFSNAQLPANQAHVLTNSGDELFHLGTTNRSTSASANFGYFSAFSFLNLGKNAEVCIGDSTVLDAGPGKTAYFWSTGETSQAIVVDEPGTYTVEVFSGTDCSATDTITVEYYEPPIDLGPNDTICEGSSTTLQIDGSFLYVWNDGSEADSLVVSEAGIYWVQVSDFQQCVTRDSIEIFTSPRPETPEVSGQLEYCRGETLNLTMNDFGGVAYRYILPSGAIVSGQNLTIENLELPDAGLYQGFYIEEGCETFTDSVFVTVLDAALVDLGDDISVCEGEEVILNPDIDGEGDLQWQDGSDSPTFVVEQSGTYWLDVSNELGCVGTDTINVEFRQIPLDPVNEGQTQFCVGDEIILSVQPQEGASYNWSTPGGALINSDSEDTSFGFLGSEESGDFLIQVELNNCFSNTGTISVQINELPVVELGEDISVCEDQEVILTPSITGEGTVEWQDGSSEPIYTVVESGSYWLSVTDEIGCIGSDTIDVELRPIPADPEILGGGFICGGTDLTLNTAAQEGVSFVWTDPQGNELPEDGNNLIIQDITPANSGPYSAQAVLNGCFSEIVIVEVEVSPEPVLELTAAETVVCQEEETELIATAGYPSYNWNTGETTNSISAGPGDYSVEVTDDLGCSNTAEISIIGTGPLANFQIEPDSIFSPSTLLFLTDLTTSDTPIASWFWDFGNGDSSNDQSPQYVYEESGLYTITLVVTDNAGCTSTATQVVLSEFNFRIPEAFSPNGDGFNDLFVIQGLETIDGADIQIFNRWGAKVFESTNYKPGNFWDGDGLPDGTYFYVLQLPNGENLDGPITIAR
jgi:gliding motility-associated-like protein